MSIWVIIETSNYNDPHTDAFVDVYGPYTDKKEAVSECRRMNDKRFHATEYRVETLDKLPSE